MQGWTIEFRDHQDVLRSLRADPDEGAAQRIAATIQDLLSARAGGGGIDQDLRRRLEGLSVRIRASLSEWGLLDERAGVAAKPLSELIGMYEANLRAKERTESYIKTTVGDALALCAACGFQRFSDIDAGKVESYLKGRRDDGIG